MVIFGPLSPYEPPISIVDNLYKGERVKEQQRKKKNTQKKREAAVLRLNQEIVTML